MTVFDSSVGMVSSKKMKAIMKLLFEDTIVDVSARFTKKNYLSIMDEAMNRSSMTIVRHTRTSHWFFRKLDRGVNILIIKDSIVAKANIDRCNKLKPLFDRVTREPTTKCCICNDDLADECLFSNMQNDESTGICCAGCGNYVCSSCINQAIRQSCALDGCPVCRRKWLCQ